ncbi:MAG: asparagine synthase-related protein, partial [Gemmatimonadaceae bacterium]
ACTTLLGFVPSWLDAMSGTAARMHGLMRDDFIEPRRGTDVIGTLLSSLDVERRLKCRNAVHAALYLWAKTLLPHYILSNLGDRMEMAHSVEGRVPFMDHHVAEYLQRVPVSLKIRGMTEKYILREAVRDVVTNTVYERQKHPFLSPPATLNPDEPLHALMQDTLRSAAAANVPFLDQRKIVATLDGVGKAGADFGHQVVTDQVLTLALSFVFMQEGLGIAA